jgi:hypothetical protein
VLILGERYPRPVPNDDDQVLLKVKHPSALIETRYSVLFASMNKYFCNTCRHPLLHWQ